MSNDCKKHNWCSYGGTPCPTCQNEYYIKGRYPEQRYKDIVKDLKYINYICLKTGAILHAFDPGFALYIGKDRLGINTCARILAISMGYKDD